MTIFEGLAVAIALVACVTDVRSQRIPNALTFPALAVGLLAHAGAPSGLGLTASLIGAVVGLAVFLPFFALGGMGGGDVKLMAALGAWIGAGPILWTALYGSVAGGVMALALAASRGYLKQAFSNVGGLFYFWSVMGLRPMPALTLEHGRGPRMPYALAIGAGLAMTLWQH